MNPWIRPIITALATAATVGVSVTVDNDLSTNDGFAIAAAALTVLATDSIFKAREVRELRVAMLTRGIAPPLPE